MDYSWNDQTRQDYLRPLAMSEGQVAELEALGYSLEEIYRGVQAYTADFAANPNFEVTKKALEIHKTTGELPDLRWYMSSYGNVFSSGDLAELYEKYLPVLGESQDV